MSHNVVKYPLISVISSQRTYEDRFRMLLELSQYVRHHFVITMDEPHLPDELNIENFTSIHFDGQVSGWRFLLKAAQAAYRIIQEHTEFGQRWIIHDYFLSSIGLFLKMRLPTRVCTLLSLYSPHLTLWRERTWRANVPDQHRNWKQNWFYGKIYLKAIISDFLSTLTANTIIVNSRMIAEDIRKFWPHRKKRLVELPTEVDLQTFHPDDRRPVELEHVTPETYVILFVSSILPCKGLQRLLEAAAIIEKKGINFVVVIVGKIFPLYEEWFQHLIRTSDITDRIIYAGRQPRTVLPSFYTHADVLVIPSLYEGSPRVGKEAMACGCGVIASDIPGSRLIDPEGQCIRFYPPDQPEALATLLLEAFRSKEELEPWGQVCQQYVRKFSTDVIARQIGQVYQETVRSLGWDCEEEKR